MPQLLAIGSETLASADFTVTDTPITVSMFKATDGSAPNAFVNIQIKGSNNQYMTVGSLSQAMPATVVAGAGTYRVQRVASGESVGVDRS